jgi:hypothetical protein
MCLITIPTTETLLLPVTSTALPSLSPALALPLPFPCPSLPCREDILALPCLGHGSGSAGQGWARVIKGSFLYGSSVLLGPGFQGNFKKGGKYLTRDLFTLPCPSLPPGLPCPYHPQHTTSSPTNLYNYLIKYY